MYIYIYKYIYIYNKYVYNKKPLKNSSIVDERIAEILILTIITSQQKLII